MGQSKGHRKVKFTIEIMCQGSVFGCMCKKS